MRNTFQKVLILGAWNSLLLMAQTAGPGFTFSTASPTALGTGGFNNDDNAAADHIVTNRSDNGERIDLDADGNYEIVVLNKNGDDDLFIYEVTADDTYTFVWGIDLNGSTASLFTQAVAVGDSDGDGNLEIVHVEAINDLVRVFEMVPGQIVDGSNPSDLPSFSRSIINPSAVTIGNLDNDGHPEILIASEEEMDGFLILESTGNNAFAANISTDVGNIDGGLPDGGASDLTRVADLDNDGVMEIVLAADREGRINNAFYVFSWDGTTISQEAVLPIAMPTNSITGVNNVAIYDIDQNGTPEIVMSESTEDRLYIYESVGVNMYAADAGISGVFAFSNMNIHHFSFGDRDNDDDIEIFIPIDDDSAVDIAKVIYFEHDGTEGAFAAINFGLEQILVSDLGNGSGVQDPRGVAYAQGSLDGDSQGDIFVIGQNSQLTILESDVVDSGVPVELQSFRID